MAANSANIDNLGDVDGILAQSATQRSTYSIQTRSRGLSQPVQGPATLGINNTSQPPVDNNNDDNNDNDDHSDTSATSDRTIEETNWPTGKATDSNKTPTITDTYTNSADRDRINYSNLPIRNVEGSSLMHPHTPVTTSDPHHPTTYRGVEGPVHNGSLASIVISPQHQLNSDTPATVHSGGEGFQRQATDRPNPSYNVTPNSTQSGDPMMLLFAQFTATLTQQNEFWQKQFALQEEKTAERFRDQNQLIADNATKTIALVNQIQKSGDSLMEIMQQKIDDAMETVHEKVNRRLEAVATPQLLDSQSIFQVADTQQTPDSEDERTNTINVGNHYSAAPSANRNDINLVRNSVVHQRIHNNNIHYYSGSDSSIQSTQPANQQLDTQERPKQPNANDPNQAATKSATVRKETVMATTTMEHRLSVERGWEEHRTTNQTNSKTQALREVLNMEPPKRMTLIPNANATTIVDSFDQYQAPPPKLRQPSGDTDEILTAEVVEPRTKQNNRWKLPIISTKQTGVEDEYGIAPVRTPIRSRPDMSSWDPADRQAMMEIEDNIGDSQNYPRMNRLIDHYNTMLTNDEYHKLWTVDRSLPTPNHARVMAMKNHIQCSEEGTLVPSATWRYFQDRTQEALLESKQSTITGLEPDRGVFLNSKNNYTGKPIKAMRITLMYYGEVWHTDRGCNDALKVQNGFFIVPDTRTPPLTFLINDDIYCSVKPRANMRIVGNDCGELRSEGYIARDAELTCSYGEDYCWFGLRNRLTQFCMEETMAIAGKRHWKRRMEEASINWDKVVEITDEIQSSKGIREVLGRTRDKDAINSGIAQVVNSLARRSRTPIKEYATAQNFVSTMWKIVCGVYKVPDTPTAQAMFPHFMLRNNRFISHFIPGLHGHPSHGSYDRGEFITVFKYWEEKIGIFPNQLQALGSYTNSPYDTFLRLQYYREHKIDRSFSGHWLEEDWSPNDLTPTHSNNLIDLTGDGDSEMDGNDEPDDNVSDLDYDDADQRQLNNMVNDLMEIQQRPGTEDEEQMQEIIESIYALSDQVKELKRASGAIGPSASAVRYQHHTRLIDNVGRQVKIILNRAALAGQSSSQPPLPISSSSSTSSSSSSSILPVPKKKAAQSIQPIQPTRPNQAMRQTNHIREENHTATNTNLHGSRPRSPSMSGHRGASQLTNISQATSQLGMTQDQLQEIQKEEDFHIAGIRMMRYDYDRRRPSMLKEFLASNKDKKYIGNDGKDGGHTAVGYVNTCVATAKIFNIHPVDLAEVICGPMAAYGEPARKAYEGWTRSYHQSDLFNAPPREDIEAGWDHVEKLIRFFCRMERVIVDPDTARAMAEKLRLQTPTGPELRKLWDDFLQLAVSMTKGTNIMDIFRRILRQSGPFIFNPEDLTASTFEAKYESYLRKGYNLAESVTHAISEFEDETKKRIARDPTPVSYTLTNVLQSQSLQHQSSRQRVHMATIEDQMRVANLGTVDQQTSQRQVQFSQNTDGNNTVNSNNNVNSNQRIQQQSAQTAFNRRNYQHHQQQHQQQPNHSNIERSPKDPNRCAICGGDINRDHQEGCKWSYLNNKYGTTNLDIAAIAYKSKSWGDAEELLQQALRYGRISGSANPEFYINKLKEWYQDYHGQTQQLSKLGHTSNSATTSQALTTQNRFNSNPANRPPNQPNQLRVISNTVTVQQLSVNSGILCEVDPQLPPVEQWREQLQKRASKATPASNANLVFATMQIRPLMREDTEFVIHQTDCRPVDQTDLGQNGQSVTGMIDDGASLSMITPELLRLLNITDIRDNSNLTVSGITGETKVEQVAAFVLMIEGESNQGGQRCTIRRKVLIEASIAQIPSADLLLGGNFINKYNIRCYPEERVMRMFSGEDELTVPWVPWIEVQQIIARCQNRPQKQIVNQLHLIEEEEQIGGEWDEMYSIKPQWLPVQPMELGLPPTREYQSRACEVTVEDVDSDDEMDEWYGEAQLNHQVVERFQHPVSSPVQYPVSSPVQYPVSSPVQYPVSSPVQYPVSSPVQHPIFSPIQSPVQLENAPPNQHTVQPSNHLDNELNTDESEVLVVSPPEMEHQQYLDYINKYCTQSKEELRPELFPEELWRFVTDEQKPFVKPRWDKYPLDRLVEGIKIVNSIKICEESEARREQSPVCRAFLLANLNAFVHIDPNNPPCVPNFEAFIVMREGSTVYASKPRSKSFMEIVSMLKRCAAMIRTGKLEPSTSPWNHPTLLVPNRDKITAWYIKHGVNAVKDLHDPQYEDEVIELFRLVMDFRELNLRAWMERFPLPLILELLNRCYRRSNRYSSADIANAYFCVLLNEACREYTAFSTSTDHLQYRVMPQGLHSAPAIFARLIQKMFGSYDDPELLNYFDDIILTPDSFEAHMKLWQQVVNTITEYQLTLKPSKTFLNFCNHKILGHIVTAEGRSIDPERVKAIQLWKRPTNLTELQHIIGTATFAQHYIENLATVMSPLHELNDKRINIDAIWRDDYHGKSLDDLKRVLTNAPVLLIPDPTKKFRIHVDACKTGRGLGAVLLQVDPSKRAQDGAEIWGPCCYWSRILTAAERRLSSVELECTALHDCIIAWHTYLYCSMETFDVFVDCYALVYLVCKMAKSAHSHQRLIRLCLDLQDYRFTVTHRKGKEHIDADALSRLFQRDDPPRVNEESDLCHDTGPLTESDINVIKLKYDQDADMIIRSIERYHEERTAELQLMANSATINITNRIYSEPTADNQDLVCMPCHIDNNPMTVPISSRLRASECISDCNDCHIHVGCNRRVIDHVRELISVRHNPQVRKSASVKYLEKQLKKDVNWQQQEMKSLRIELLKEIAEKGVCTHLLRMKKHDPSKRPDCAAGECWCIQDAQLRHEDKSQTCRQIIRSIQSGTLKELQHRRKELQLEEIQINRILYEIRRREQLETVRLASELQKQSVQVAQNQVKIAADRLLAVQMGYTDSMNNEPTMQSVDHEMMDKHTRKLLRKEMMRKRLTMIQENYDRRPVTAVAYSGIIKENVMVVNAGTIRDSATSTQASTSIEAPTLSQISINRSQHQLQSQPDSATIQSLSQTVTRQQTGNSRPTEAAIEHHQNIVDRDVRRHQRQEQEDEQQLLSLEEYQHLHSQLYIHPDSGQLFQVCDTTTSARDRVTGRRTFKSTAWPVHSDNNHVTLIEQRDERNWDIRQLHGANGTIELIKHFQMQSDQQARPTLPSDATQWIDLQLDDPDLQEKMDECIDSTVRLLLSNANNTEENVDYLYRPTLSNGQIGPLMRKYSTKVNIRHGNIHHTTIQTYDQFVVPRALRRTVLFHLHDQMGHPGRQRMLDTIRLRYWWPGMNAEIQLYSRQCRFCELRKANNSRPRVPIQAYRIPLHPFHVVHVDLTGPLSKSENYEYLLVCKDALTKYTIIRKLVNKRMKTVIPTLVEIFNEYGAPRVLISDRGTEFTNISLRNVCRLLQSEKIYCTASNPRSNGLAENAMRTIKDMLAFYVNKKQNNWSTYISTIQHIYNTTINISTGYTPFYLLFGRECPSPDQELLTQPMAQLGLDEYVKGLRDSLALAWDSLSETFWTDKTEVYNSVPKKRLPFKMYEVDQLIYIKRIPKRFYKHPVEELDYHLSSKLQERFSGPFRVTKVLSPVLYKAMIHGKERVIHAINMKPARVSLNVVDSQENEENRWQEVQQFNDLSFEPMDDILRVD